MMPDKRSMTQTVATGKAPSVALRLRSFFVLSCIFATSIVSYRLVCNYLSLGHGAAIAAAGLLLFIFALVIIGLRHHCFERFGFANTVTAIRAAIVCMIAALVFFPSTPEGIESVPWILVGLVILVLAMDGLDGYLARRFEYQSDLGARFDMEVDALLVLCLAAAAFLLGKGEAWVLLIGLMRYAFVLAQYPLPRLRAHLPSSLRRKLVCVVQVAVLCLVVVPGVLPPASSWLLAISLLLLCYSFAIDCLYLFMPVEASE
ncbi:CDP-alcohol phosphatidyltransferase [Rhizobium sp. PDO1-076]|uniref:CDP-alcohol phosphatidyltransferase family protein n=1 Tax=Rhizobium sp. PDO1-076 TaxID=1125979 RepID=UPI00024E30A3|nr:CDP-alcohol phosphatidyltransferase family protein [Rhizobium sp. PDO1-076]EHS51623.1 CDP-alcohol phosphatidyltransferase [Rhizobium sp. PDO1-076]